MSETTVVSAVSPSTLLPGKPGAQELARAPSKSGGAVGSNTAKSASEAAAPIKVKKEAAETRTEANQSAVVDKGQQTQELGSNTPTDQSELSKAVKAVNDTLTANNRALRFSVDEATGKNVVRVVDTETNKVVQQLPPEEVLKIAQNLAEAEKELAGNKESSKGLLIYKTT